ncbi:MAG TPA: peroxiredoxin, partial [Nitrospiria bacterium]|nr:peroxiredoxin [Nitrospiria bacterium]
MAKTELKEGGRAPAFRLPSSEGRVISLSEFKGKKAVVLFFYPKDNTPGCTIEACDFRDGLADFKSKKAVIL